MENLEIFEKNYKFGIKDEYQEIILPAEYDCLPNVKELEKNGVAIKHKKAGLINSEGELIVNCVNDDILILTSSLYATRKNIDTDWSFAVHDINGATIVDYGKYKYIKVVDNYIVGFRSAFSQKCDSLISLSSETLYTYSELRQPEWMDFTGKVIYKGEGENINGCIIIEASGKYGFVNRNGQVFMDQMYDEILLGAKGQLCVKKTVSGESFWNVILTNGELLLYKDYYSISCFGSLYKCYENSKSVCPIWLNDEGLPIFNEDAEVLGNKHLVIFNGTKYGVLDSSGKRILNYSFDSISCIDDAIIILKNNKVGLVGWDGRLLIEPLYDSIEFVNIHDKIYNIYDEDKKYGSYSSNFIFDTDKTKKNEGDKLLRCKIIVENGEIHCYHTEKINTKCPILLQNDDSYEIFTIKDGTLPYSRYSEIFQITNDNFVIKNDNKFGVYNTKEKRVTIDCAYDRIKFMGSHSVFLEKDGLWGAQGLHTDIKVIDQWNQISIPCKYLDIQPTNIVEYFFSIKEEYRCGNKYNIRYCVVNRMGEYLVTSKPSLSPFSDYEAHFISINSTVYSHIFKTKWNGKYGLVHKNGYVCVPFKYDELTIREDGDTFDACIGNAWGILDISGREIVAIKYAHRIPSSYGYIEVTDALSGCKGILNEDGSELLPSVYDYILPFNSIRNKFASDTIGKSDYYAVGFGGIQSNSSSNFFCDEIYDCIWGVVNNDNELLVEVKYDCIKMVDTHFLCGRNGNFLYKESGESEYAEEYEGEYDVVDLRGNLIFGGCTDFHYDNQQGLYFFKFGGKWKYECTYEDEWNNIELYSWIYYESNSRWLILDKELSSIIPTKQGRIHRFKKGYLGKITTEKDKNGHVTHYWNMPLELFSIKYPIFVNGIMFYGEEGKMKCIRLKDRACSGVHYDVDYIDEFLYFYKSDVDANYKTYVGIGRFKQQSDEQHNNVIVSEDSRYILITYPIKGYSFGVREIEDSICEVYLLNLNENQPISIVVISRIDIEKLFEAIVSCKLLIEIDDCYSGLNSIKVKDKTIFDNDFANQINNQEIIEYNTDEEKICYWYSDIEIESRGSQFYDSDDVADEPYSWEDSMMDALDGDPDAYWNID